MGSSPAPDRTTELRLWVTFFVLSGGFFVGMEWLFFVTKPSFLDALSYAGKVRVFGATVMPLFAGGIVLLVALATAARIPVRVVRVACAAGMRALPTLVLAISGLLLVDNFTTTVFGWGIASLRGARLAYVAGVVIGIVLLWRLVGRGIARLRAGGRSRSVAELVAVALVTIALVSAGAERLSATTVLQSADRPARRPNVLLFGMDGVNASHLSLYGYERPTSPFLTELARSALVFTNAYSNAGNTGGSLVAMLTGRLPTETHVIFAPDILRGDASMLHLPGLLRINGYRTGQFAVRHYAASVDFNLRDGFDVVNDQQFGDSVLKTLQKFGFSGYFLEQITERVGSRIASLSGHRQHSGFAQVTKASPAEAMDGSRLQQLEKFIRGSHEPWFAHIHLLVTHGERFAPRTQRFSAGETESADWMRDFYDDAILEADESLRDIVEVLRQRGMLNRTLIVIYSDHAQGFRTDLPVPLVVRLPDGSRHERLGQTVQSIDIAPTILDVLGLPRPDWMAGQSLLRTIPACRRVFGAAATTRVRFMPGDYTIPAPPFFSLGAISLVQGNQAFVLDVEHSRRVVAADIPLLPGAVAACEPLNDSTAQAAIVEHLRTEGYDVSTLEYAAQ